MNLNYVRFVFSNHRLQIREYIIFTVELECVTTFMIFKHTQWKVVAPAILQTSIIVDNSGDRIGAFL